jgi:hypothetical protein
MSKNKGRAGVSRRHFLLGAGVGATAVAASQLASAPPAEAYNPGQDEKKARYQLSEEVKTFYRVNGYETKRSK